MMDTEPVQQDASANPTEVEMTETKIDVKDSLPLDATQVDLNTPAEVTPTSANPILETRGRGYSSMLRKTTPIQLEWSDITYSVNISTGFCKPKAKKIILDHVTGFVAPGEVLAIMGPSGSGKTTTLNILSQRIKNFKGTLTINGKSNDAKLLKQFRNASAFVQQDDVLLGNLTVREALVYAALLRMPASDSLKDKIRRVDEVIDELGLFKCQNTKIGVPGLTKGISGGERKRLSIGIELLTGPSLLFLDEPTTGLDAKTALNVMQTIVQLAKSGRTIVLTIHQPRSDIVSYFDKLLLLARGRTAYFGKASDAVSYFSKLGHTCPPQYNLADFVIDLTADAAVDNADLKKQQDVRIEAILDAHKSQSQVEKPPALDPTKNFDLNNVARYQSNWIIQFGVLFARSLINIARDRMLTFARLFQTVTMALLVGLIYLRTQFYQSNVQDRIGVLFFILVNQAMGALFSSVTAFPAELAVFLRERGAKTYHVSAYFLGKSIAEIPNQIIFPVLFGCICYWMVGLNPLASRFFIFLLISICLGVCAQSFGQLISVLAPRPEVSMAIAPVVTTVFMLFGGFYLNVKNIPVYFIWIYWISFFHFAYEAFVLNEFAGLEFLCKPEELRGTICPISSGDVVIQNLNMTSAMANVWVNIGLLIALAFLCKVLTFLALRFLKKPRAA